MGLLEAHWTWAGAEGPPCSAAGSHLGGSDGGNREQRVIDPFAVS